jgi:hypothetical protein
LSLGRGPGNGSADGGRVVIHSDEPQGETKMKSRLAAVVAATFALSTLAAMPAYAEQSAFRTPAAQTFSSSDLQSYGLSAEASQRAVDLQKQGYEIKVLSEEEAAQYQAGITDNQWLLLGILAGVIVIAVAVSD